MASFTSHLRILLCLENFWARGKLCAKQIILHLPCCCKQAAGILELLHIACMSIQIGIQW